MPQPQRRKKVIAIIKRGGSTDISLKKKVEAEKIWTRLQGRVKRVSCKLRRKRRGCVEVQGASNLKAVREAQAELIGVHVVRHCITCSVYNIHALR